MAEDEVLVVIGGFSSTYQRLNDVACLQLGRADAGWRPLPPLLRPRVGPAAAPLAGGGLLVAGGAGDGSAELFEAYGASAEQLASAPPGAHSGGWQPLPPMAAEHSGARALTLGDGRVVVIGGLAKGGRVILDTVEAYDPATRSWSALAPLHTGRVNFAACALPGGSRLLVAGGEVSGIDMSQRITQSVELYDSAQDSWAYLPELSVERYGCGCGVLPDGAVLVVGGYGGKDRRPPPEPEPEADGYTVGSFATLGLPPQAVVATTAATPAAEGGAARPTVRGLRSTGCPCCAMFTSDPTDANTRGRHLHSSELLLDFGSGEGSAQDWTWLPGPPMATARKGFAEAMLSAGGMVVLGGVDADGETRCDAECLPAEAGLGDKEEWAWQSGGGGVPVPPMVVARTSFAAVVSTAAALGLPG